MIENLKFEGTFERGLVGKVFIRKADLPSHFKELVDRHRSSMTAEWQELSTWEGCKFVARKVGNSTRHAHLHYGGNRCCMQAEVKIKGFATYGISKTSMPVWMRASLDAYWTKSWPKARVTSWTRNSMTSGRVVVEVTEGEGAGKRYEIEVEQGLVDGSNLVRDLTDRQAWLAVMLAGV